MQKYTIASIFRIAKKLLATEETFATHGWVRVHRQGDAGKIQFVKISDGTTLEELQCVYHGQSDKISYQSSVQVIGKLVKSPASEQPYELVADSITVLGDCPADFPLPRKKLPMSLLRQHPDLRLKTTTMQAVMRIRSCLAIAVHDFFEESDFVYLHTPILTSSDCEGAGEVFTVSASKDFFPTPMYLTVSGQLQGEAGACAMSRIYTFGPTFRAEKSDTSRHLSEFWMIEPEIAFCDAEEAIQCAEDLMRFCIRRILDRCPRELAILEKQEPGLQEKLEAFSEFKHITYTQAVEILRDRGVESPPEWGTDLETPHERYLVEEVFKKPVVVRDYPKSFKAFYMHQQPDGKTVACFDILLPGIGEVVGGSQREVRYDVLVESMKARGLDISKYQGYLDIRRYGGAPHSGYGLGFDRLVRFCTGMAHIRDVVPWPVGYKRI